MHLPWSYILHMVHAAGDGERIKAGRSSGLCAHSHILCSVCHRDHEGDGDFRDI